MMKKIYIVPHLRCLQLDDKDMLCVSYTESGADGDGEELNNEVKIFSQDLTSDYNIWDEEW